ncbi:MAG TPA: 4-hydroxy-tetrahydrodipicolinate synthase [Pseudomonadales bacterium]|nr:4-hydroxy-tetrahydrodipicolinate synthase [Pseudomonadales bacterium]
MFQGSMVALVTPMHADGAIDWDALDALVDWHIEQGTNAIVAVGTTGESATLSVEEHKRVIEATVRRSSGRCPIIAGTGANATAEAIELTEAAKHAGADACLLVVPYYNKPTQEGLYLHHKAISEAVDIPQILYNVPGRTACDMLPATVARIVEFDNVVGIKEATGDMQRAREVLAVCEGKALVYSGDDATAIDMMLLGGKGNISVTANIAPAVMANMCAAAIAGDAATARTLNAQVEELHRVLFVESNPIPVKWAVEQLGRCGSGIRLPLTPLSSRYHDTVRAAMRAANLL